MYSKVIAEKSTSLFHDLDKQEYFRVVSLACKLDLVINNHLRLRSPMDILMLFLSLRTNGVFVKINSCLRELQLIAKTQKKYSVAEEIEKHLLAFQKTFRILRATLYDQEGMPDFLNRLGFCPEDVMLLQQLRQSITSQQDQIGDVLSQTLALLNKLSYPGN